MRPGLSNSLLGIVLGGGSGLPVRIEIVITILVKVIVGPSGCERKREFRAAFTVYPDCASDFLYEHPDQLHAETS